MDDARALGGAAAIAAAFARLEEEEQQEEERGGMGAGGAGGKGEGGGEGGSGGGKDGREDGGEEGEGEGEGEGVATPTTTPTPPTTATTATTAATTTTAAFELDHISILERCAAKQVVLVLHTEDDEVHPSDMARRMHRAAIVGAGRSGGGCVGGGAGRNGEGEGKGEGGRRPPNARLVMFEGGGHNYIFPFNFASYSDALFSAMVRVDNGGGEEDAAAGDAAAGGAEGKGEGAGSDVVDDGTRIDEATAAAMERVGWRRAGGWWTGTIEASLKQLNVVEGSGGGKGRCSMQ